MPRKPRQLSSTNIYHVVIKGADSQIIFAEEKDFKKYLELLSLYKEECHFDLYAYCLMSNHIHLLLHINECSLETVFRKLNTNYAVWFNQKYQRTGHVQDGRFYSEPVEDVSYLLSSIKYIHNNPTKAGLETAPGCSYPWSSFYEYKVPNSALVDTNYIYKLYSPEVFLENKTSGDDADAKILDIDHIRRRIPDDVALDIMRTNCNCYSATEFLKLSLVKRNKCLKKLHSLGISLRQLNRITGVSLGIIKRVVTKGHS